MVELGTTFMSQSNTNFIKNSEINAFRTELQRCVGLFNSGVLASNSIFAQSVFIEVMIRLNDILKALDKENERINFSDDVSGEGVTDVTMLVRKMRNAACHDRVSREAKIGRGGFVFNRIIGKGKMTFSNKYKKNIIIKSDYNDDVAFLYGDKKIYLKRHILRLLSEIEEKLSKLEQNQN